MLVVGAGPAGLECALALGRRGYEVTVAEAAEEIGGRLRFETRLPGLAAWGRVLDWRRGQLERLPNVSIYRGNRLTAEEILELGTTHVVHRHRRALDDAALLAARSSRRRARRAGRLHPR